MALSDKEVLESFKKTESILKGHFILTSGRHSDTYMQCAKLFTDPRESEKLCAALAKNLEGFGADLVVSPAIGGIIMGYETARQLKIKNIFAERVDGKMAFRRGFEVGKGQKVIVTEDVVTTGGSVMEVIELVKESGGIVVAVASIVDRSNGKTDFGVPYRALLTIEVQSYEQGDCPLCKEGKIPPVKPGSRGLK